MGVKEKPPTPKNLRKAEISRIKAEGLKKKLTPKEGRVGPIERRSKYTKTPVSKGTSHRTLNFGAILKRMKQAPRGGKLPGISLPTQVMDVHEKVQKRVLRARRAKSEGRYGGET